MDGWMVIGVICLLYVCCVYYVTRGYYREVIIDSKQQVTEYVI